MFVARWPFSLKGWCLGGVKTPWGDHAIGAAKRKCSMASMTAMGTWCRHLLPMQLWRDSAYYHQGELAAS